MIYEQLYDYDAQLRQAHGSLLCGCDEAGRGPLAGPVCCAAVILPQDARFEWLNDSKKVTEKRRERLYEEIVEAALYWSCEFVDNEDIDKMNILAASLWGMKKAVENLTVKPDFIAVDGNKKPDFNGIACEPVVKGDSKSASIAAASIIAKVTRDRFMRALDEKYPQYGFAKHKGYPTKEHYAAIAQYGVTQYHRLTFLHDGR